MFGFAARFTAFFVVSASLLPITGCREENTETQTITPVFDSEIRITGSIPLESYLEAGIRYLDRGYPDSAFGFFTEILKYPYYVQDTETAKTYIEVANQTAVFAASKNRTFQALSLILDAYEIGEKFGIDAPYTLVNAGVLYTHEKNFEKAYISASDGLQKMECRNLYSDASLVLGNLLTCAMGMGDIERVDSCLQRFCLPAYDTMPTARFGRYRARMYLAMQRKEYDSALLFIREGLRYATAFSDTIGLYAAVYKDVAGLYHHLGKYDSALAYYAKSARYNYARNDLDALQDIFAAQITLLDGKNRRKEYKEAVVNYTEISQAIKEKNRTAQQQNIDYMIRQRKQDREISKLYYDTLYQEKTITKQKALLWLLAAVLVLAATLFIVLYRTKQRKARTNRILYEKTRLLLRLEQERHKNRPCDFPDTEENETAASVALSADALSAMETLSGTISGQWGAMNAAENAPESKITRYHLDEKRVRWLFYEIERLLEEEECYTQEDFSLDKLAQMLESNTSYVSRIVNELFHKSFSVLLNEYRVRKSCLLMDDTKNRSFTLEYIGSLAGFGNRVTFTKQFKKQVGMTPSEYWRIAKNKETAAVAAASGNGEKGKAGSGDETMKEDNEGNEDVERAKDAEGKRI